VPALLGPENEERQIMAQIPTLPKVDIGNPTPKYLQARTILLEAIRAGQFAPGSKLPSTGEISALVDVSLITAHKALDGLVREGWLRREVGRGTYVREDVDPTSTAQRQLFIGLLLHHQDHVNIDDYYHSTLLNGLRRAAREDTERRVQFFFQEGFNLRDNGRRDVGAICLHPPLECQPDVERLTQHHPVVILGGTFPHTKLVSVDCDNADGARRAVRHLLELGHRRFLVLSGPVNLTNAQDRTTGARAELNDHGITLSERNLALSQDSVVVDERTKAQIEQRMMAADRPTAVVAGGFYLAATAMQVVRRLGLRIPTDVSIVGFDDPRSAPLLDPPLTTVRQPLEKMAARAYELACRALTDKGAHLRCCKLSAEFVVRNSTGSAP